MARMSSEAIVAAASQAVSTARTWNADALVKHRKEAMHYYRGDPFGNEEEGRSQVVSRDVAQYIDTVMPSLMRIFASGDEIVHFEPTEEADEKAAQQATDYCNWIWNQQNDGFVTFHHWFKDGLLNKLGTIKIWWDDTPQQVREVYQGLSDAELKALSDDQDIEVGEVTPRTDFLPSPEGMLVPVPVFDAVVTKTNRTGRVKVAPVPPEEFIIGRRAKSDWDADVLAHYGKRRKSDLLADGYSKELVERCFEGTQLDTNQEVVNRFQDVDSSPYLPSGDTADREVEVVEAYLHLDINGDGKTEYCKVCYSGSTLLEWEEVDDHPFATVTPILMPHRMVGMSMADQLMDLQLVKSTIWRQMLDNLYLTNAPQTWLDPSKVNIDDVLNRRVGGVIRVKDPGAIGVHQTPPLGPEPYNMLEYLDTVGEQRTGATRYNQGLDANSLNKTATGINLIQNAAAQRIELIARVYAETGVKRAFRRILQLVCKHQQKPRVIRLRGEWVEMDPRAWKDNMDMTVTVGLGTGNRDQIMAHMMTMLQTDMEIVKLQGGVNGPLVTANNVYEKLKRLVQAAGLKGDQYYTDPAKAPPQQQQPDPKVQAEMARLELERVKAQQQIDLEQKKAAADAALARQKAADEMDLKIWQAQQDAALERQKADDAANMGMAKMRGEHEARLVERLTGQQIEMQTKAVQPIDAKVTDMASRVEQQLQGTAAALQEFTRLASGLAERIEAMAEDLNAPREIVRGEDGRAVGVKVGNRVRNVARGPDGRATGLQ